MIDLTPLKANSVFRLLFVARAVSMLTYGILSVALSWQVFVLSGSSLQVGLVGFCNAASMMVGLLVGGTLADRSDRRRLMMLGRSFHPLVVGLLLINAMLPTPHLWIIYVTTIVGGLSIGFVAPALMAATASAVEKEHLAATGALTALVVQIGALVGPSMAGALIASFGVASCYGVVGVGSLVTLAVLSRLPALSPEGRGPQTQSGSQQWLESLRFVWRSPLIGGLLLIDAVAVLFASPFAVLPELGTQILQGGPSIVGLLYTAPAAGALVAVLTSGWLGSTRRPGGVLILAVLAWGASIAAAGLSSHLVLTLLLLGIAGFSDTVSEILRVALLQTATPDHLRGRVSSLWLMQATVGPALGGVQIGAVARLASPAVALAAGGLVCLVATGLTGAGVPALRNAKLKQDT